MTRLSVSKRSVLAIIATASVTARVCLSFSVPSSVANLRTPTSLLAKDEHNTDDHSSNDTSRRKILSILQAAPLFLYQSASAQVEVLDVATPQISASQKAASRLICADLEEENRITIFERVAPSVVYIDTFAEKRDVFSTNV